MAICPKDLKPCCDDICYGAGCIRIIGNPSMLVKCHGGCGGLIAMDGSDTYDCTCDRDDDDFDYETSPTRVAPETPPMDRLEEIKKRHADDTDQPLSFCRIHADRAWLIAEVERLRSELQRFLNPEDMGFAVSAYVRDTIREILGRKPVENTPRPTVQNIGE